MVFVDAILSVLSVIIRIQSYKAWHQLNALLIPRYDNEFVRKITCRYEKLSIIPWYGKCFDFKMSTIESYSKQIQLMIRAFHPQYIVGYIFNVQGMGKSRDGIANSILFRLI